MNAPRRLAIIHGALALLGAALVAQAVRVQVVQGERWAARARNQQFASKQLPAPRGVIRDATGTPLAESREMVRLSIAPQELCGRPATKAKVSASARAACQQRRQQLTRALVKLGVTRDWVARATDTRRKWVTIPGRFLPVDVAALASLRGVYPESMLERVYLSSAGAQPILGRLEVEGEPTGGVEAALDSVLRGTSGASQLVRGGTGARRETPGSPPVAPTPGHEVVLTLNHALQEIIERALADAVARREATGGDILVLDPRDGSILAMAGERGAVPGPTALTEPFEPGSTIKPFIVSALLSLGRARPEDSVETFNGSLTINGRTITDLHKAPRMSMVEVVRQSSNIGIVQFAQLLSPREEFEALRDFGFGTPTGIAYPSESPGRLREPRLWSTQSAASLAMGYEVSVTPLQLALAYAALANGGELLEPALIREIRSPDGELVFRHTRRVVRRVVSPVIAQEVRQLLASVVDSGTASGATLATFAVAGKSGTARRTSGANGYAEGSYTASFVGVFPAEDPQFVVLVKLDNPRGEYYGGRIAAPVTKVVLEAALAARDAALDRRALALQRRGGREHGAGTPDARRGGIADSMSAPVAVNLASAPESTSRVVLRPRPVPEVRGLPLRSAVYTLHRAGFKVQLVQGAAQGTLPTAGTPLAAGGVVRLFYQ